MNKGTRVKILKGVYAGQMATVQEAAELVLIDGQTSSRYYRDSSLQLVITPSPSPPPATPPATVPAGSLFVSPTGADTNPGTEASPFRTIAKIISALGSGQTGVLRSGTYLPADINSSDRTLMAYPGEKPGILGLTLIRDSANGWTFKGITFSNTDTAHHTLEVYGDNLTFEDCDVSHPGTGATALYLGYHGSGGGEVHNFTWRRGAIHSTGSPNGSSNQFHGVYAAWVDGLLIEDTYAWDHHEGWFIQFYPDCHNATVRYCTIADNRAGVIYGGEGALASTNCLVERCIIANSSVRPNVDGWWSGAAPSGCSLKDSVCWQPDGSSGVTRNGFTESGTVIANPQFVDPANNNYRLKAGSPAAGYGVR